MGDFACVLCKSVPGKGRPQRQALSLTYEISLRVEEWERGDGDAFFSNNVAKRLVLGLSESFLLSKEQLFHLTASVCLYGMLRSRPGPLKEKADSRSRSPVALADLTWNLELLPPVSSPAQAGLLC